MCACLTLGPVPPLAVAAASSPATPPPCPGSGLVPTAADEPQLAQATLCLVDRVRSAHHLPRLHANHPLQSAAARQLSLMLRFDYFGDVGPQGQDPLSLIVQSGYDPAGAPLAYGQNLAWGSPSASSPAAIVTAWMHSPPHRAIILDPVYSDAGAAAVPSVPAAAGGGPAGATYAMEFAHR